MVKNWTLDGHPDAQAEAKATAGAKGVHTKGLEMSKKPRCGIYIWETSRSIHERAVEHFKDAESFPQKSHMVKHWMLKQPELRELPKYRVKVLVQLLVR